jgi:hypothetical protein
LSKSLQQSLTWLSPIASFQSWNQPSRAAVSRFTAEAAFENALLSSTEKTFSLFASGSTNEAFQDDLSRHNHKLMNLAHFELQKIIDLDMNKQLLFALGVNSDGLEDRAYKFEDFVIGGTLSHLTQDNF